MREPTPEGLDRVETMYLITSRHTDAPIFARVFRTQEGAEAAIERIGAATERLALWAEVDIRLELKVMSVEVEP